MEAIALAIAIAIGYTKTQILGVINPSSRNGLSLLQNYTSSIVLESFKLTGSMSCGIISFILVYIALAIAIAKAIGYTKT